MNPLRVAIVGFGKIARDQHVPAIAATDGVELVAVASRNASLPACRISRRWMNCCATVRRSMRWRSARRRRFATRRRRWRLPPAST